MPKNVTRRQLLVAAAPAVAAVPLAKLAFAEASSAAPPIDHAGMTMGAMGAMEHGHAAMVGSEVPAPGGPNALDALLYPPKALPHQPGRVREYALTAIDRE